MISTDIYNPTAVMQHLGDIRNAEMLGGSAFSISHYSGVATAPNIDSISARSEPWLSSPPLSCTYTPCPIRCPNHREK